MANITELVQNILDIMPREGIPTMDCPLVATLEVERRYAQDILDLTSGTIRNCDYELAVLGLYREICSAIADRKKWSFIRKRVLSWAEANRRRSFPRWVREDFQNPLWHAAAEDWLLQYGKVSWNLLVYGKQAVDAALEYQNGACYRIYQRQNEPVCQIEAVLSTESGDDIDLVSVQPWDRYMILPTLRFLLTHGFRGCWIEVYRRWEHEDCPVAIEEDTATVFQLGKGML